MWCTVSPPCWMGTRRSSESDVFTLGRYFPDAIQIRETCTTAPPPRVANPLRLEVVATAAAASASLLTGEPLGLRERLGCMLISGVGLVESLAKPIRPHEASAG